MWFSEWKREQASTNRQPKRICLSMDAHPVAARERGNAAIGLVRPYAETALMVAASTAAGLLVAPRWGNSPVDLLYLPAVLAAAGFYGFGPGLVAAVGSALAFNFYFTQPYHTFRISSPSDVATVAMLFIAALVTSQLAAKMRAQARSAESSAARNATIAGLARRLLSAQSEEQVGSVACREIGRLFECNAVLLADLPEPRVVASGPRTAALTPSDIAAAAWSLASGTAAGRGAKAANAAEWTFCPIRSEEAVLAAVGLARDDGTPPVPSSQLDLLDNLIDQVALALDRTALEGQARQFAAVRERDRARSVLLSTIAQDIGPRLSAITRAADGMMREGKGEKAGLSEITAEASKLQRYISNLHETGFDDDEKPVEAGDISIDLFHRTVSKNGEPVHLTPKEYAVIAELARYRGRVLPHAHLLRTAWGPAQEDQSEYLRVAIRALRQKLEDDPSNPRLILNEPAVGYRLSITS